MREGSPLLQAKNVLLQAPKRSFYKYPKCAMPAVLTGDRRCTMQVMSQGLSCWREHRKTPVLAGRELEWSPRSVITLCAAFDRLGDQENITM